MSDVPSKIDQFIQLVDHYFYVSQAIFLGYKEIRTPKSLSTPEHELTNTVNTLRKTAPVLAKELEAAKEDNSPVLRVMQYVHIGRVVPEGLEEVWPEQKVSLQRIAIRLQLDTTPKDEEDEEIVANHIKRMHDEDTALAKITRDGIAKDTGLTKPRVSATPAWQKLAAYKRQQKIPSTPEGLFMKANQKGDWEEVESRQRQESMSQV